MNYQEEETIKKWRRLTRSQRISLLEEYEFSMLPFEQLDQKQRRKFERLVMKNYEFRHIANWEIIIDLKNINENLITKGIKI